jgi:hypothetical protein
MFEVLKTRLEATTWKAGLYQLSYFRITSKNKISNKFET